jgi:hypothetical protein
MSRPYHDRTCPTLCAQCSADLRAWNERRPRGIVWRTPQVPTDVACLDMPELFARLAASTGEQTGCAA